MRLMINSMKRASFCVAACFFLTKITYAMDTQPLDFIAPSSTGPVFISYYFHNRMSEKSAIGDSELNTSLVVLRGVYWYRVGGYLASVQFAQPFGKFSSAIISGNRLENGDHQWGDTSILASITPLEDHENGRFIGAIGTLTIPVGSYRAGRALNLGGNRWAANFQVGGSYRIGTSNILELIGDTTVYGHNDDIGMSGLKLKQKPSYQINAWYSRVISGSAIVSVGYSYVRNGMQDIGGISLNNNRYEHRVKMGYGQSITNDLGVMLEVNRDIKVQHGMKRDLGLAVRFTKQF